MSNARAIVLHVVLPLVLGVLIYVAWRREAVLLVSWLPASSVSAARHGLGAWALPRLLLSSGADAGWGWAFGAAIALVWRGRKGRARAFWFVAAGAVAAWAELGQIWQFPPGTFDIVDLLAIVGAYALGAFFVTRSVTGSVQDEGLADPGRRVAGGSADVVDP